MRRLVILVLILGAACSGAPSAPQNTASPSIWSAPITLAQAQQADAPALLSDTGGILAVWVGSDDRGVHQDARRLTPNGLTDEVTLPLPPTHPYEQSVLLGDNGNTHLLWLDADANGQTTLYSALLAPDLTVVRGPVDVSNGLALDYSAVTDGSGGIWVAWGGGLTSEMSVSLRHIDDQGRPLLDATAIASNADDPALVRTNRGDLWGFWLQNGQLMAERLDQSSSPETLTSAVSLASGDRLIDVNASLDSSNAYFFWNITRASGVGETWLTSGSLSAGSWRPPTKLSITVDSTTQIDSGYKLGSIPAASSGGSMALRWLEPLTGQYQSIAAAVESDAGLGVVILDNGDVAGYTTAAPGVQLIGRPEVALTVDGNLALAWAASGSPTANLQLIQTQR